MLIDMVNLFSSPGGVVLAIYGGTMKPSLAAESSEISLSEFAQKAASSSLKHLLTGSVNAFWPRTFSMILRTKVVL